MKEAPYSQYVSLRGLFYRPWQSLVILFAFLANMLGPVPLAQAQDFRLPAPGVMVHLSPPLDPPILKGIKVHPDNPFRFDFILDKGDSQLSNDALKDESSKLIKYFLASLTIPEKDLWVNLSPYEKDRIIPQSFGLTEMGRDLLAEDYMLKQITASLIYPEDEVGRKFWKRIYKEAAKRFGTTSIPVNTFNKVWIVPEKAVVYENAKAGTAYVVESKLKVMLEQDYLALSHTVIPAEAGIHKKNDINALGSQIVREVVIPELTKEINEDKNFAQLRQVYNSLILATWYKKKIKASILSQVYVDKNKTVGVQYTSTVIPAKAGIHFKNDVEGLYREYLKAFKKGVYNYIKEEEDPISQQIIPRKYFSGGFDLAMTNLGPSANLNITSDKAMLGKIATATAALFIVGATLATPANQPEPVSPYFAAQTEVLKSTQIQQLLDDVFSSPDARKFYDAVDKLRTKGPELVGPLVARLQNGGFARIDSLGQEENQAFYKAIESRIKGNAALEHLWQSSFIPNFVEGFRSLRNDKSPEAKELEQVIMQASKENPGRGLFWIYSLIRHMDKQQRMEAYRQLIDSPEVPEAYKKQLREDFESNKNWDKNIEYLLLALQMAGLLTITLVAGTLTYQWRYDIPQLGPRLIDNILLTIQTKVAKEQPVDRELNRLDPAKYGKPRFYRALKYYGPRLFNILAGINKPNAAAQQMIARILYAAERKDLKLNRVILIRIAENPNVDPGYRLLAAKLWAEDDLPAAVNFLAMTTLYGGLDGTNLRVLGELQVKGPEASKALTRIVDENLLGRDEQLAAIRVLHADGVEKARLYGVFLDHDKYGVTGEVALGLIELNNPEAVAVIEARIGKFLQGFDYKLEGLQLMQSLKEMTTPVAQEAIGRIANMDFQARIDEGLRLAAIKAWNGDKKVKLKLLETTFSIIRSENRYKEEIISQTAALDIPEAVDALEYFAESDPKAIEALGEMTIPEAQKKIEQIVRDENRKNFERLIAVGIWNAPDEVKFPYMKQIVEEIFLPQVPVWIDASTLELFNNIIKHLLTIADTVPAAHKILEELAINPKIEPQYRIMAADRWLKTEPEKAIAVYEEIAADRENILSTRDKDQALQRLQDMDDPRTVSALVRLVKRGRDVIASLAYAKNSTKTTALRNLAHDDKLKYEFRLKAIAFWGDTDPQEATILLEELLQESEDLALKWERLPQAIPRLEALRENELKSIHSFQQEAINELAKIAKIFAGAVEILIKLARQNDDLSIKSKAVQALLNLEFVNRQQFFKYAEELLDIAESEYMRDGNNEETERLVFAFFDRISDVYSRSLSHQHRVWGRYRDLKDAGIYPLRLFFDETRYGLMTIGDLSKRAQSVRSGAMDIGDDLDVALNYSNLMGDMKIYGDSRQTTFAEFSDMVDQIRQQNGWAKQAWTEINDAEQRQIRGLVYESYLMYQKILGIREQAKHLGRPVVVVENLSYGAVALAPITQEQRATGRKFIVGTDIPVISTKIGSTESHHNEFVLREDLFTNDQIKDFMTRQPIVIVVDGSTSVSDLNRTSAHIPDGFKGYRNYFMALNLALTDEIKSENFYEDSDFVQGLESNVNFQALTEKLKQEASEKGENWQPYQLKFWYPGNKDLYLRVNKQKVEDRIAPKLEDVEEVTGPTIVFIQSGLENEAVPQEITQDYIKGEHTPVYFDDKNHYKRFFFTYKPSWGFVLSKQYIDFSRQEFKKFLEFNGKSSEESEIPAVLQGRNVHTIALDLDGTIAAIGANPSQDMINTLRHLIEQDKQIVILTDDIEANVDVRLKDLLEALPENRRHQLTIFSDSATKGYTFRFDGSKVYLSAYNQESLLVLEMQNTIRSIVENDFSDQLVFENRPNLLSPYARMDLRVKDGLSRTDIINQLRQIFRQKDIQLKIYKIGKTGIRIVRAHKENALKEFMDIHEASEENLLVMADSARTDQMDRELLNQFPFAVNVNLGVRSKTFLRNAKLVFQMRNEFQGPQGAFQILQFLAQRGHVPEMENMAIAHHSISESANAAMLGKYKSDLGGIDFNSDKMNLQLQNAGKEIKFHIDPAMLKQLQNAPGFVPVIINIQPMTHLRVFLGLNNETEGQTPLSHT